MKTEAREIQDYLEIECLGSSEEIIDRINKLAVYMARSGEMLALAKSNLRKAKAEEICKKVVEIAKQNYLSAKAQNSIIESIAKEEAFLVDWLDRINRSCTHQIDLLRSELSYEKDQMKALGYQH